MKTMKRNYRRTDKWSRWVKPQQHFCFSLWNAAAALWAANMQETKEKSSEQKVRERVKRALTLHWCSVSSPCSDWRSAARLSSISTKRSLLHDITQLLSDWLAGMLSCDWFSRDKAEEVGVEEEEWVQRNPPDHWHEHSLFLMTFNPNAESSDPCTTAQAPENISSDEENTFHYTVKQIPFTADALGHRS